MRFDRFTERAQDAVAKAYQNVQRYSHSQVDTEHLFMALLEQNNGALAQILDYLHIDLEVVNLRLDEVLRNSPKVSIYGGSGGQIFYTPRMRTVVELSQSEATQLKDEFISTEHLILGILNEHKTPTSLLLQEFGITKERVLEAIQYLRGGKKNKTTVATLKNKASHDWSQSNITLDYLDFELEVRSLGGREYQLVAESLTAGKAREQATFPLDTLQLENSLLKLHVALARSDNRGRKILSKEEQSVQDFGIQLFNFLFPKSIFALYERSLTEAQRQNKGLRLKLHLTDSDLAHLPWEFLHHQDYLCLAHETPLVRYVELARIEPLLSVSAPLRVLGVIGPDYGPYTLDMAREKERIGRALDDLQEEGLLELHWLAQPTWRDLARELRRRSWHIFHFIGHGGFDETRDEGYLLLGDDSRQVRRFYATELGRLLSQHRPLRLVLLNACEGAKGGHDLFSSTAHILMAKGLPAVLAMQYEITDKAAIEFARTFYETIAEGWPVDRAVSEARLAMSFAFTNTVEWGVPVLFMRSPDGVLFKEIQL
ncbi:MAG: CHAT domain-containing protein [Chloroflexi bacterium]|nr:CHAT domain-containing protein [Chloroflexota bacterium]